jgi:hypothetical protein
VDNTSGELYCGEEKRREYETILHILHIVGYFLDWRTEMRNIQEKNNQMEE